MGQSVMFDYAKKAFLAQARQKSPDTWSGILDNACFGTAKFLLSTLRGVFASQSDNRTVSYSENAPRRTRVGTRSHPALTLNRKTAAASAAIPIPAGVSHSRPHRSAARPTRGPSRKPRDAVAQKCKTDPKVAQGVAPGKINAKPGVNPGVKDRIPENGSVGSQTPSSP
jgi:hypothetical protein